MTGALSVSFAYFSLVCSDTRVQRRSRLTVGQKNLLGVVVVSHTDLSEVTRMVFVRVDSVVMLTSSVTTATRVLPMLSNWSMAYVASQLLAFIEFNEWSWR